MSAIYSVLQVARSNVAGRTAGWLTRRRGQPPQSDEDLGGIKVIIDSLPIYGSRRVHAHLVC
jgi:hypothetical protein